MGFAVTWPNGTTDAQFQPYARLLHQRGVDLAKMPRVPDPVTGKRWLHVWDKCDEAKDFAQELRKQTEDPGWEVVEVKSTPSEGPLGPIEIEHRRVADEFVFALHPFSKMMIQNLYPKARLMGSIGIDSVKFYDFKTAQPIIADFADHVVFILTGLDNETIMDVFGGFRIFDQDEKKEVVSCVPTLQTQLA